MFVENRIEIVIICSRVADLELAGESGVAVVSPLGVVVPLPELDWTDVGADEDGGAQEGVEGGSYWNRRMQRSRVKYYLDESDQTHRRHFIMVTVITKEPAAT